MGIKKNMQIKKITKKVLLANIKNERVGFANHIKKVFTKSTPKLLITLHACDTVSIKELSSAFNRLIRNRNFGTYIYCYEIGVSGNVHIHVITSNSFNYNYIGLKKSWMLALSKIISAGKMTYYKTNQSLDCRALTEGTDGYMLVYNYILKCEDSIYYNAGLSGIYKYGGSLDIKRGLKNFESFSSITFSKSILSKTDKIDKIDVVLPVVLEKPDSLIENVSVVGKLTSIIEDKTDKIDKIDKIDVVLPVVLEKPDSLIENVSVVGKLTSIIEDKTDKIDKIDKIDVVLPVVLEKPDSLIENVSVVGKLTSIIEDKTDKIDKIDKIDVVLPVVLEKPDSLIESVGDETVFKDINGNVWTFDKLFAQIKSEYSYSGVDEVLLEDQIISEIAEYSSKLNYLDFNNFVRFISTRKSAIGKYYMDLYMVFQSLCNSNAQLILHEFKKHGVQLCTALNKTKLHYKALILYFFNQYPEDDSNNVRVLFLITNLLYKLFRADGSKLTVLLKSIGMFVVSSISDDVRVKLLGAVDTLEVLDTKNIIHIGHILYSVVRLSVFSKNQDVITLYEENNTCNSGEGLIDDDDFSEMIELGLLWESPSLQKVVRVEFNLKELAKLVPQFNKQRFNHLQSNTKIHKPCLVPPKAWLVNTKVGLEREGVYFYDASKNYTGGVLINNILIKRPLCKKSNYADHRLFLESNGFALLNKIQTTAYCLDSELLSFYLSNKNSIFGYLSGAELRSKKKEIREVSLRLKKLYKDKTALVLTGRGDPSFIISQIQKELVVKKSLQEKVSNHYTLFRLLKSFESITQDKFYFANEYDFRMRMYPVPFELSYASHKLSRSLIRFYEKCSFDVRSFQLYCVSQYVDTRDKDESTKQVMFETDIRFLLEHYNEPEIIRQINTTAREPYLFYACAVEWCRYLKSASSETYKSNFPVYYDCTAQGPQIVSVFFALRTFSKYLNLCQQDKSEKRGDYYSAVITKYLEDRRCGSYEEYRSKSSVCLNKTYVRVEAQLTSEVIDWFRKQLKQSIMTLIYGVSARKFMRSVLDACKSEHGKLVLEKIFYIDNFDDFQNVLASDFWSYTHTLPIFQMKPLLQSFNKNLGVSGILEWSVFDTNLIRPRYLKFKRHQLQSRVFKERYQLVIYDVLDDILKTKQMSSLLANFTHSLDAWILRQLYVKCGFPIMAIHDSYGIHSINENVLRQHTRSLLIFLLNNGFDFFTKQWATCLENSVGVEARDRFLSVVEESKKSCGDLSEEDISQAYHFIS